ncbi:MAG: family transporter [Frankiales bacterium]|nr:family transporter [Frankiales bacterium]
MNDIPSEPARRGETDAPAGSVRAESDDERQADVDAEQSNEVADAASGVPSPAPRVPPAEAVAWSLRATAEWCIRILIVAGTLYLAGKVYQRVHLVAFSFLIGLLITAVLRPVFVRLVSWGVPRALAALSAVLLAVLVLAGVGYFVADQISSNTAELSAQLQRSVTQTSHWLATGPLHLKQTDLDSVSSRITSSIKNNQAAIASGALSTFERVAEGLSGLLLVVLTSFFLIKDGDKIWGWTLSMLPHNARSRVAIAGERSWSTLGGYVRGQVTIALFHAVSITAALFILRVPLAAPLGVLVFLGSFIPLFGMVIAGGLCVIIALIEHGPVTGLIVLGIVVALVQLESHVLQPLVMSRAVEIHPLAVALAVVAGTKLDGISGALLAVPLVAVSNTALRALHGQLPPGEPRLPPRRPRMRPKRRPSDSPSV